MRGMRWIVAAAIVALSTQGRAMAQEAPSKPASMTPLEVLADAFKALEAGKVERYVDHLSAHEQQMQAGYALYTVVALTESKGGDFAKPAMVLLAQGMRDVAIRHLMPRDRRPGEPIAIEETPEMQVRKLLTSLFVQPAGHTAAGTPYAAMPQYETQATFDEICLKASKLLKDPRAFLIDSLQELSLSTEVSGAEPDRPLESFDLAAHARMYQQAKWTLYTRGDRALAVPKIAQSENPPAANPKAGEPAKAKPPAAAPPAAGSSDDDSETFHIDFRKIDGQWKIDRLLPVNEMQTGIRVTPSTTQAVPYPAEWK